MHGSTLSIVTAATEWLLRQAIRLAVMLCLVMLLLFLAVLSAPTLTLLGGRALLLRSSARHHTDGVGVMLVQWSTTT